MDLLITNAIFAPHYNGRISRFPREKLPVSTGNPPFSIALQHGSLVFSHRSEHLSRETPPAVFHTCDLHAGCRAGVGIPARCPGCKAAREAEAIDALRGTQARRQDRHDDYALRLHQIAAGALARCRQGAGFACTALKRTDREKPPNGHFGGNSADSAIPCASPAWPAREGHAMRVEARCTDGINAVRPASRRLPNRHRARGSAPPSHRRGHRGSASRHAARQAGRVAHR
jgi:hypothetical protein